MLTEPTLRSELLAGQVAIVTGGGQGIGRATVEDLAANGAKVVVVDVDSDRANETAAGINAEVAGDAAIAFAGDLTDPAVPDKVVAFAAEQFGRIDILVNVAGYFWDAMLHKMTDEQFQAMLDIHLVAPFRLARAVAPYFRDPAKKEAADGVEHFRKVVMVSSLAASFGNVGAANYAAAKAGLIGLAKSLASEWGPFKINVNTVAFGVISTRFGAPQSAQETVKVGGREIPLGVPDKIRQKMSPIAADPPADFYTTRPMPGPVLGRTGSIQEAADAILWLCSPLSNYVTGQVIPVSGGARGGMS